MMPYKHHLQANIWKPNVLNDKGITGISILSELFILYFLFNYKQNKECVVNTESDLATPTKHNQGKNTLKNISRYFFKT
jgi:hypothetical protein